MKTLYFVVIFLYYLNITRSYKEMIGKVDMIGV